MTHYPADSLLPLPCPPRPLPTLEQLFQMTPVPGERVVIRDVDWAFYEQLVDFVPEGVNIHVDYDGENVEIMALSPFHDGIKKRLGRFVELVAEELEVAFTGPGADDLEAAADRSRPGSRRVLLLRDREVDGRRRSHG